MNLTFRDAISSSLRYWEPRRLIFNLALLLVVAGAFLAEWPTSKQALHSGMALDLFILAVLANVAYCAAYLPDLVLQFSTFRDGWLRWRWALLSLGILFAGALTYLFTLGLFTPIPD